MLSAARRAECSPAEELLLLFLCDNFSVTSVNLKSDESIISNSFRPIEDESLTDWFPDFELV